MSCWWSFCHVDFVFPMSRYHLKDVIVGKIYFLLVRIKIKHMEIAIIKRETTGSGPNTYTENVTIAKYEIMDGAPVRGKDERLLASSKLFWICFFLFLRREHTHQGVPGGVRAYAYNARHQQKVLRSLLLELGVDGYGGSEIFQTARDNTVAERWGLNTIIGEPKNK